MTADRIAKFELQLTEREVLLVATALDLLLAHIRRIQLGTPARRAQMVDETLRLIDYVGPPRDNLS